jgi:hypothetical protein
VRHTGDNKYLFSNTIQTSSWHNKFEAGISCNRYSALLDLYYKDAKRCSRNNAS